MTIITLVIVRGTCVTLRVTSKWPRSYRLYHCSDIYIYILVVHRLYCSRSLLQLTAYIRQWFEEPLQQCHTVNVTTKYDLVYIYIYILFSRQAILPIYRAWCFNSFKKHTRAFVIFISYH